MNIMPRNTKSRIAILTSGAAVTVLGILYCPVPWASVLFAVSGVLIWQAWWATRTGTSVVMMNLAAICMALAIFEIYLSIGDERSDGTRIEGSITEGFTHSDDILGYAPNKNSRVTARKYYEDSLLYDAAYTIDSDGLRIAPPSEETPEGCVVFFGDSVTFGEGVNDTETFPYRVGIKTNGRYAIYNFAFSGYGPHQMLASLQAGIIDQTLRCKPTQFLYLTIPEHIARVAGLTFWDRHGPRFKLGDDGLVVQDGHFDDNPRFFGGLRLPNWMGRALRSSLTWGRLFGHRRNPNSADLSLYLGVVRESARIATERYKGAKFDVILWDGRVDDRLDLIDGKLRAAGIPVHRVTSAIPNFRADWKQYILSVHDPHPNPLQHERLADYIVSRVLHDHEQ
jgi:hypothetical protein